MEAEVAEELAAVPETVLQIQQEQIVRRSSGETSSALRRTCTASVL